LRQTAVALALVTLAACNKSTGKVDVPPVDGTGNGATCGLDTSLTFESAFVLVPDTDAADTICPRKDHDFWRLDLVAGRLVTFDVKYEKLADMQLAIDWYGPVGACMPTTPTTCAAATDCPGQTCDAPRGGCRRAAPGEQCVADTDCQAGELCVAAPMKLGSPVVSLREAAGSATIHRVTGTVGSVMAGPHYFVVYDAKDTLAEASTKYHLTASVTADPDVHEVNDAKNLAAAITSGTGVDGYLSRSGVSGTAGDVDWYVIAPPGGAQQVATVELTSPSASGASPSWTLYQGAQSFPSTKSHELGTANGTLVVRSSALVMPDASAPIYVQVSDTTGGADTTHPYHLTVTLAPDASEPTRDDTPETAQAFAAGAPTSGATHTFTGTIVAENDQDWYRIDKAASPTDHSLLYFKLQSASPDILLQATTFMPSSQSCTQDTDCTSGPSGAPTGRCLASHKCLVGLLQRPAFDVVGDPQLGGLTPNYIESQQPLFASGTGALYLLVSHNASTTLPRQGYSATGTYTLEVVHKAEPDSEDALNPDNKFVSRPLMPNLQEGDFRAHARTITPTISGGTGGAAFVAVGVPSGQSGTYAVVSTCVVLPLFAFDALGAAATGSTSVTLTPSDATAAVSADCTGTKPAAGPLTTSITGATGTVGYWAGAAAAATTLTTSVGGVAAVQALATVPSGTTGISFVAGSAALPRRLGVGLRSPAPVRLLVPTNVTATKVFALDTLGKANFVCHTAVGSACPGATGLTNPCGTALTGAGAKTACQVAITTGQTYDLDLAATSAGLVTLTATDTAATLAPTTFVATATTPQGLTTATASGYLSYEGDEDFFTIPVGSFPIAGLTLTVDMAASPLDLRVNAARFDPLYGIDRGSSARAVACDDPLLCAVDDCASRTCESPGTCNAARKTCDQPTMHQSNGPAGTPPQCVWVAPGSATIEVRVNDMQSNDWDEVHPYSFTLQLTEGCPVQCAGVGYSCTP